MAYQSSYNQAQARHSPDAYPPNSPNFSDEHIGPPRPFRSGSAQSSISSSDNESGDRDPFRNNSNPHGSTPSLPRYSSGHNYANPSPLNPSAVRGGREGAPGPPSRYSSYGYQSGQNGGNGNGAHPLSNAMYLESSPTLAGSEVMSIKGEKSRKGPGGPGDDGFAPVHVLNGPQTGAPMAPYRRGNKPKGLSALYRAISGANLADSGQDERHIKLPRLGYLDGIKFIAAWVVLNGTLFDAVLTNGDYSFIQRNSPLYITRSTGLGITFLLLLSGRSLVTPLWDVPASSAVPGAPNAAKPNTALISWARLTRAMLVRPFRFILPVIAVVAVQWGLGATNKTSNCNAVGMDEPYWGLISNFAGFATLVFDLFTHYEENTLAGKTFAANLFVSPWFFVAGYAVYTTHFMLGNLSSNRYWVYGIMMFFSWTTYNYIFVALMGLVIADMHAHGHLHRIRTKWPMYRRIGLHAVLIVIACVTQFVPVVRDNINKGLAVINVQNHPELTICDSIFAVCWLFCIETSGFAQTVFGNVVMRSLGKLAPGLVLLAPAITFTIVPNLALSMHNNGSSASSVLGLSWLVLFLVGIACAIAFHFVVELPSKLLGELISEALEGGQGAFRVKRSSDGKITKRLGGGANKLAKQQQAQQSQPLRPAA